MFGCMSDQAVASKSAPGSLPSSSAGDEFTIDKLLGECVRLKRKNKDLKMQILQFDTRQKELSGRYEADLRAEKAACASELACLKAQHFIELSQLRDYRVQEIGELTRQLHNAQKSLAAQNPLVTSMTDKVAALERSLERAKQAHFQQLEQLKAELSSANGHRASPDNKDRQMLLNRALSAESALQQAHQDHATRVRALEESLADLRAQQPTSTVPNGSSSLVSPQRSPAPSIRNSGGGFKMSLVSATGAIDHYTMLERLRGDLVAKQDEVDYFAEENARLEKQVLLMRQELAERESSAAKESSSSATCALPPNGSTAAAAKREGVTLVVPDAAPGDQPTGILNLASPSMRRSAASSKPQLPRPQPPSDVSAVGAPSPASHRRESSVGSSVFTSHLSQVDNSSSGGIARSGPVAHSSGTNKASVSIVEERREEYLDRIRDLKAELVEAKKMISFQEGVIQDLTGAKGRIEEGVRRVLEENVQLGGSVEQLRRECDRLRAEVVRYKGLLAAAAAAAGDESHTNGSAHTETALVSL